MLMKQVELIQDDGAKMRGWIDRDHAIVGHRFDLNLGEGERSPVVTVARVWQTERDREEIQHRQTDRKSFGGSIR